MPIKDLPLYSFKVLPSLNKDFQEYKKFLLEEHFERASTGEFDKIDVYDLKQMERLSYDNPVSYFNIALRNNWNAWLYFEKGIPWRIGFIFNCDEDLFRKGQRKDIKNN